MKTVEIRCDGCGGDLTDAGAMPTNRLELTSAAVANSGGVIYAVAAYPEIKRPHHFCDLNCLDHWRDRERFRNELWRERSAEWKESQRNGQVGDLASWHSMPDEVRKTAAEEIDAATLAAFPMTRPSR